MPYILASVGGVVLSCLSYPKDMPRLLVELSANPKWWLVANPNRLLPSYHDDPIIYCDKKQDKIWCTANDDLSLPCAPLSLSACLPACLLSHNLAQNVSTFSHPRGAASAWCVKKFKISPCLSSLPASLSGPVFGLVLVSECC